MILLMAQALKDFNKDSGIINGMNELILTLKKLLASTVALKYKAHGYHWNVETDDFPQYHDFFGKIYESLDDSIDPLAEWIRMLGDYAPFKLSRFVELSTVPETMVSSDHEDMAADLLKDHMAAVEAFKAATLAAGAAGEKGLENFLADCLTMHQKWVWQLKACVSEVAMEAQTETPEPPQSTEPSQG